MTLETPADYVQLATGVIVIGALAYAIFRDTIEFRIPNWISILVIAAYVVDAAVTGRELHNWMWDASMASVVLLIGYALYSISGFGAGDVKLMTAVALYVTIDHFLTFVLGTMLLGGVVSLIILALNYVRELVPVGGRYVTWLDRYRAFMPYGVAIALAGIFVIFGRLGVFQL